MFDLLLEILKTVGSLSPVAALGLLATTAVLALKGFHDVEAKMDTLTDNHLHELPELVENSRRTVDVLQRIEVKLGENFAAINEKLNVH